MKNIIVRNENISITKVYRNAEAFYRELSVYQKPEAYIPRLISFSSPNAITMEYIDAQSYLNQQFDEKKLAKIISSFHNKTRINRLCLCHIDNNPKNILYDGANYYLIDFEETKYTYPEIDLIHLCMFWFDCMPIDVVRERLYSMIQAYLEFGALSKTTWNDHLPIVLNEFINRRMQYSKNYPDVLNNSSEIMKLMSFPLY